MNHITVALRVRGIWKVRVITRLIALAARLGIVVSIEHGMHLAKRAIDHFIEFRIGNGDWTKWKR